ncbi:hypothetical protein, partial [Pseudonocardia sp. KRD291]|uniref:hypothetical protein n=1 Tax=Pseudonocardia sp. KRD291 TaxID=2792007 RepID=UPI001C49DCDD
MPTVDDEGGVPAPAPPGRRSRGRLTRRARAALPLHRPDPMDVLDAGLAITAGLAEGPGGGRATDALHRLGTLVGATAAGLVGPAEPETGTAGPAPDVAWWGPGR